MGLGKTIQAIAATEILARHFGVSKVLVICPTSLKYQWQSEITRFSGRQGEHAARVIYGGRAQRQKDCALDDFCKITNYEKLRPDLDLIAAWAPELVIVDEAQRVKNWNTIAARALKRVDSPYAIVLTGTPLENKLEELISIVQFVDQHRLGPTWKLLHEHQLKDEAGRVTGYTGLDKIGKTLAPVMIRRRKSEVLRQLPGRTDQNLLVPMTEPQMEYHRDNADEVGKIVMRWRRTRFLSEKRPALVEQFRNDPACRVFLSTDAGSTGLNLQHASTLVNMDLPWNPAVLEQRIARIHRIGQVRPIRIVNFVAKGTIEEGM